MARVAALLAAVVAALGLVAATATPQAAVWQAMRTPGAVIIVRHSYAPGTFDPPDARLEDCATQRNLDETGRAQARRIGEEFRKENVTVGAVLSSPRCRCLETGRLAFGRAEPWMPLQGALRDDALRQRLLAQTKERIAAHRDGPPLVLVTHGSVVTDLTGLNVRMGELVVLRRGGDGAHAVAGQLYVE
jgi:broad specificity phosphatase PhoE